MGEELDCTCMCLSIASCSIDQSNQKPMIKDCHSDDIW